MGHDLLAGLQKIQISDREELHVRCKVEYMSHSDHTDARGIMHLIAQIEPLRVVLVHGAAAHMHTFRPIVEQRLHIPCSEPAVGEVVDLNLETASEEVLVSPSVFLNSKPVPLPPIPRNLLSVQAPATEGDKAYASTFSGLLLKRGRCWELHDATESGAMSAGVKVHRIRFRHVEPAVELQTMTAAWHELETALREAQVLHTWDPAPVTSETVPRNQVYKLSFLSVTCTVTVGEQLQAVSTCTESKEPKVSVHLEWERNDGHTSWVRQFLEALGAG